MSYWYQAIDRHSSDDKTGHDSFKVRSTINDFEFVFAYQTTSFKMADES